MRDWKRLNLTEKQTHLVTWDEYNYQIGKLAEKLAEEKFQYIYGIPRGGLVIAIHLSHLLEKQLITKFPDPRNTIIIDDVSDTGKTLKKWQKEGYTIATLHRKRNTITEPDFCVKTINKWIIYPWEW